MTTKPAGRWAVAVHGGAGMLSTSIDPGPYITALTTAVNAAVSVLENGHAPDLGWSRAGVPAPPLALAACLEAAEHFEGNVLFNAGKGSVLNEAGFVENEAAVMYGATRKSGAVCGLRTVVNPSRLATVVHAVSPFQFLGFSAAERFSMQFGPLISHAHPDYFVTDLRRRTFRNASAKSNSATLQLDQLVDHSSEAKMAEENETETIGAVVCDGFGNVACITSTGGITCKSEGRIGDTPMIGAGSYADNRTCALSGTGIGEEFIRTSAGTRVSCAIQYGGMSLNDAVSRVVNDELLKGAGGIIAVNASGEVCMNFNSTGMYRASRTWKGDGCVAVWDDIMPLPSV